MNRNGRMITTWTMVVAIACSTLAAGCEPSNFFGSNLNVNVVVPLGLAGTPGLLNPFGVVQAFVNALLGADASTGDTSESGDPIPSTGATPPGHIDPSISAVLGP